MFLITPEPLDPALAIRQVRADHHGAVAVFLGVTRNHSEGKRVLYLEYDAYPELAEKKMRQIAGEVQERWGLDAMAILHRIGRLEIGETSLVIAVAGPHRKEALEACHYAVDRLKEIVPIWKKEVWEGGEVWVEGHQVAVCRGSHDF